MVPPYPIASIFKAVMLDLWGVSLSSHFLSQADAWRSRER
jgi:hypothetical protein